jgi:hypothetical protein
MGIADTDTGEEKRSGQRKNKLAQMSPKIEEKKLKA